MWIETVYFGGYVYRRGGRRLLNQECCCSSTLGSENSLRNRGLSWAGRSNAATKAFHWPASNEKRRWSASVCSASAQALRMMKPVRLSPRSCAPRRISFSCCAEVLRFRRRDRGAFKVEGITSSSVRTLYVADNFGSQGRGALAGPEAERQSSAQDLQTRRALAQSVSSTSRSQESGGGFLPNVRSPPERICGDRKSTRLN